MAGRPATKPVTMEGLLNPEYDKDHDVAAHKTVEMAFPAHGNGDIFDFLSKNATAGNKRVYVSPKVKRLACETMAALGVDMTMKQYEHVLLKGPEEAGRASTPRESSSRKLRRLLGMSLKRSSPSPTHCSPNSSNCHTGGFTTQEPVGISVRRGMRPHSWNMRETCRQ